MLKSITTLIAFLGLSLLPAFAEEVKIGALRIETPWARGTPKGAEVGSAYLTVHNDGSDADALVGGSTDIGKVEVHEMSMAGGVMKMRELKDGLTIAPHAEVTLAPGGFHLMLVGLKQSLAPGQVLKVTLKFAKAGEVVVDFPILPVGSPGPNGAKTGTSGMKM